MTAGQIAQAAYLVVHAGCLIMTIPALYRLLTGYRPVKTFDPIKASMALLAVAYINNNIIRSIDGAYLPSDFQWILAGGLNTIAFLGVVAALFITERVVNRAREP